MANSTVNGKKIGKAAGKDDKIKLTYGLCGKRSKEQEMDTKINEKKPTISIIESLRNEGQIVSETSEYVSIKAYPGTNPNKEKQTEDLTH